MKLADTGRAHLAEGYAANMWPRWMTMFELRYQLEACRRGAVLWLRDVRVVGGAL